jgi:hypothetical protein
MALRVPFEEYVEWWMELTVELEYGVAVNVEMECDPFPG